MTYPEFPWGWRKMMGPEAALVSARIAELRALGRFRGPKMPKVGPMYAEVAARVRWEPFYPDERSIPRWAVWVRIRAVFRRPKARRADSRPDWTVAASPIVAKESLAGQDSEEGAVGLLAGLPLRSPAYRP